MNKNQFILFILVLVVLGACKSVNSFTVRPVRPSIEIYFKPYNKGVLSTKLPYNPKTKEFYGGKGKPVELKFKYNHFNKREQGTVEVIYRENGREIQRQIVQPNVKGISGLQHLLSWTVGLIVLEPFYYWWAYDYWRFGNPPKKRQSKGGEI